ncbi:hypothetical protein HERIO_2464 [Hepatospora eriocheir]|uniref:Uncharacterized protein n=1 Tax=Hepatospora eriocheir TaxID=1081669 RepID=A0A1X0Q6W1_9MICR|nr:hypothetical protein HERIO_2464 [Hepatospora eriocheir]
MFKVSCLFIGRYRTYLAPSLLIKLIFDSSEKTIHFNSSSVTLKNFSDNLNLFSIFASLNNGFFNK